MWFNDHDEFDGHSKYNIDSNCFDLWWSDTYFTWWSYSYNFGNLCFTYCKCSGMWFNNYNELNSYSEYHFDSDSFDLWWRYAYFTWWRYSDCFRNVCFSYFKCCGMWFNDHDESDSYSEYYFDSDSFNLWWSDADFTWWSYCNCYRNVCFSYYKCSGMWFNNYYELNSYSEYNFYSVGFDLWWSDTYFAWWSNSNHFRNVCFSHFKCSRLWFNDHD